LSGNNTIYIVTACEKGRVELDCSELPIGDLNFLKDLTSRSGAEIVRELVECAPPSIEKESAAIKQAIKSENRQELKDACHAFKGACYSVQMSRLACLTKKMEAAIDDMRMARSLLPELDAACEEAIVWWYNVLNDELYL